MMSLIAIVGVVSYFVFLIFLIGWQVHQVEELCKKMLPGTPVAKIRPAIEKHRPWNGLVAHQFGHEGQRLLPRADKDVGLWRSGADDPRGHGVLH